MRNTEIPARHAITRGKSDIAKQQEIYDIEYWFVSVFAPAIAKIQMCDYFKITRTDNEYAIMEEAYKKEQRLRELKGLDPLEPIRVVNIFGGNND